MQQQPKRLLHWYVLRTKATPPPDMFKQKLVLRAGRLFNIKTFVETGTYHGDMTAASRKWYDDVYSIELKEEFYKKAVERFAHDDHVEIINGHSAEKLKEVAMRLQEPAVFWLDAHGGAAAVHNGEMEPAPVKAELDAILTSPHYRDHVVLIDDVHTFVKDVKWGAGVWKDIEEYRVRWLADHPDWIWKVKDNVLRIYRDRKEV